MAEETSGEQRESKESSGEQLDLGNVARIFLEIGKLYSELGAELAKGSSEALAPSAKKGKGKRNNSSEGKKAPKKPKEPTQYNLHMRQRLAQLKQENPEARQKELFAQAAHEWKNRSNSKELEPAGEGTIEGTTQENGLRQAENESDRKRKKKANEQQEEVPAANGEESKKKKKKKKRKKSVESDDAGAAH